MAKITSPFYHEHSNGVSLLPKMRTPDSSLKPMKSAFPTPETPVLIIGGGPIGVFSAILLARYNIRSTIVERHASGLNLPRAHAMSPRTVEILRQAGLDVDRLRDLGAKPEDSDMVRFATCLAGYEYGKIPLGYQFPDAKDLTPEPLFNVAQPLLEDYLYEVAQQAGLITVWKEIEWQSSIQVSGGLQESSLYNRRTQNIMHIRSKYLLACDGANAQSREKLQIPFSELPGEPPIPTHYVTVYFQADLRKLKSGTLFFIISPNTLGTFICYDRGSTWAFVMIFDPEVTSPSTFTEEYCRSAVAAAIGESIPFKVLSNTIWSTLPRIADTYRSPTHPGAFVVGDAAHAFPPTGGLGLNSGFGDAHNLVWKIYATEKKWPYDSNRFLDSYDQDRRAVALVNSRQSYINQRKIAKLVETILSLGINDPSMQTADASIRKRLEEAVLDNWDHFNSINLQIGYVYGKEQPLSRSVGEYIAECTPGGRVPHSWIRRSSVTCSTLDLIDGYTFVLLATRGFLPEKPSLMSLCDRDIPVMIFRLGIDFTDPEGQWSQSMDMTEEECGILVRPDQHIVSRLTSFNDIELALKAYLSGPL